MLTTYCDLGKRYSSPMVEPLSAEIKVLVFLSQQRCSLELSSCQSLKATEKVQNCCKTSSVHKENFIAQTFFPRKSDF